MAYSSAGDMLLGDLKTNMNKQAFVDGAADEIDARLGMTYVVPVGVDTIPTYAVKLLKKINNFLATGRFLEAAGAGVNEKGVSPFAASLIKEAQNDLERIVSGQILLEGAALRAGQSAPSGPSIINADSRSAVDEFAAFTGRWPALPWPRFPWAPPIYEPNDNDTPQPG